MSNQPPPVPPANRSDKGPGRDAAQTERPPKDTSRATPSDPGKTGQQGNTAVNTTHQGHQQDR